MGFNSGVKGLNGGIILEFALQKWIVKVWTECMWLRRGTSGGGWGGL